MSAVVATSPLDRVRTWYAGLEPREQQIVLWGGVGGGALAVLVVLLQLHSAVNHKEQRVAKMREDLAHIQAVLPELRAAPLPQGGDQSLVVVVDRTTRDAGLAMHLRGTEPAGPTSLRVRLDGAPFDATVNWLLRLQREYGTRIQAATMERTEAPGVVNATLTLSRP